MNYSRFKNFTFFGALAAVSITFVYLLKPFLYPILWAAIIAGMFYPVYKKINAKIKHSNLSSLSTILIILIIIIIPVTFIGSLLFKESVDLYASLTNNQSSIMNTTRDVIGWIHNNPITDKLNINEQAITDKLTEATTVITNFIFDTAKNITQNSFTFLIMFMIMFYTLFFFFRDGEKILRRLAHLSPLGEKYEEMMYAKFTSTARAVLKGTMVIGAMQGFLTGLTFYFVGIQGALVWGIITTFFSVIPGFGSYLVWLPAVLIMFITGHFWQAIAIIGAGLFISTIDNFIRPTLVGKDAQMHPMLILFSTLGGLLMFGISGFILGPIITALFLSLWEMYEKYYQYELDDDVEK
jgi:predicted PurR-regulated permease PerM